jgi:hypothetical protein
MLIRLIMFLAFWGVVGYIAGSLDYKGREFGRRGGFALGVIAGWIIWWLFAPPPT